MQSNTYLTWYTVGIEKEDGSQTKNRREEKKMKKIGNWYFHRDKVICRNYGGWVVVDGYCYDIFKTLASAKSYIDKHHDGSNKTDPIIIGKMTDEQFINALS